MLKSSVKLNDVSHDFNFQREILYVTHITPLKAVILLKCCLYVAWAVSLQTT